MRFKVDLVEDDNSDNCYVKYILFDDKGNIKNTMHTMKCFSSWKDTTEMVEASINRLLLSVGLHTVEEEVAVSLKESIEECEVRKKKLIEEYDNRMKSLLQALLENNSKKDEKEAA